MDKVVELTLTFSLPNLFVLSSVKDLDPELLNAGVTNYPVTRTFTGGVSFVF